VLLEIRRFLDALAWAERGSIREIGTCGGSAPHRVGKPLRVRLVNPTFHADYIPDVPDPKATLALALYRDGMSVNAIPFKFLAFYKIVNMLHAHGPEQVAWINDNVDKVYDPEAQERVSGLRAQGDDIGQYLYVQGRYAIAHTYSNPVVDPDDPAELRRLSRDLPVMKALAEHAVEREFGVPSRRTIWQQHLYELDGFRALMGEEVTARVKAGETVEVVPVLPRLSIRVRGLELLAAFERLEAKVAATGAGTLTLTAESADKRVHALVRLDFGLERLRFDPVGGVTISDDGSIRAVDAMLDQGRLIRAVYSNGQLEVWDATKGTLLGRCDPFIPRDIDLRATLDNLDNVIRNLMVERGRRAGGAAIIGGA